MKSILVDALRQANDSDSEQNLEDSARLEQSPVEDASNDSGGEVASDTDPAVAVEETLAVGAQSFDHARADGDVGDKASVHHVDVDPIGTRFVDGTIENRVGNARPGRGFSMARADDSPAR